MNSNYYRRGLLKFEQYAKGAYWYEDFLVLANALRENVEDILPEDSNTYRQGQTTIFKLNELAIRHLDNKTFNELCDEAFHVPTQIATKGGRETYPFTALSNIKRRWAVLVGVNKYVDKQNYKRLPVCANDALAVRDQLVAGGFEPSCIYLLTDGQHEPPTRGLILHTLKSVASMTEPDDLLLFYYTGHGDEENQQSYLIAHDGRKPSLSETAIPVAHVEKLLQQAPARSKIMLLDACHAGIPSSSKGAKPMSEAFIQRVFEQAYGLVILASCTQNQKSWLREDKDYSLFTYFLIRALEGEADFDQKGFVTMQDINRYVTDKVKMEAYNNNRSQTPSIRGNVVGDIICVDFRQKRVQSNIYDSKLER